jgi:DNA polymerase III subunit delta'
LISTVDAFRGQQRLKQLLERYLAAGRLGGTLLLLGERGLGKTTLATIIARGLACEANRAAPRLWFCGECYACRTIAGREQPEYVTVRPKSQDIKVEQIEKDHQGFRAALLHPIHLSHRFFLIDDAHCLNEETGNQLLKVFEEAPEQTVFLLVTDKPHLLLPTIHSRGQKFNLAPEPLDAITNYLALDAPEVAPAAREEAALLSTGRYVEALGLAHESAWRQAVHGLARVFYQGWGTAPAAQELAEHEYAVLWAKELADTGLSEDEALKQCSESYKEAKGGPPQLLTKVRQNELKRVALISAYDRAAWLALQSSSPPPHLHNALSLLRSRINQNVDRELAQVAFEISVARGIVEQPSPL